MNEDMSNLINKFSSMLKNNELPPELSNVLQSVTGNSVSSNTNSNPNRNFSSKYNKNGSNHSYNNSICNNFCNSSNDNLNNSYRDISSDSKNSANIGNIDFSNINIDAIKNILGQNSNSDSKKNNDSSSFNIDINTMLKMKSIIDAMNSQKDDPRANLLKSLKPYLKESRKEKVDQYIKIFSMEKVFEQIDNLFVNGVINGIISIIIAGIVLIAINKLLNKFIKKKWPDNYVLQKRIKKIILITIFLAIICSEVKFLKSFATALLASGGIVAVVIGLASQEAAGNLINGAMIMAYKPYKIGDFIVVTGHNVRGTVIDISLRHSVIETLEKTQMIVPNDIMNKAIIENISQIEHVKANYLYIDISYESDIDQAIKVIQDLVVKHPLFIDGRKDKKDPLVPVIVSDLKDSSIQLRATITSEDNVQGFQMLADIRKDLVTEFKKEGIEIPYPHMHIVK